MRAKTGRATTLTIAALAAIGVSVATAAPVQLVQQGRLIDAAGAPINGAVALTVSLCPNASPTVGEDCFSQTWSSASLSDGYFSVVLGDNGQLDHRFFDAPALWVAFSTDGGASELGERQPMATFAPHAGMLYLGGPSGVCGGGAGEGAIVYDAGSLRFCDGDAWRTVSTALTVVSVDGTRQWSDGDYATSCETYARPTDPNRLFIGDTGSGVYWIDPDGQGAGAPFKVHCDMSLAGGGWTLALNLDTSDNHVMWWGAAEWTNTGSYGVVDDTPFSSDSKTLAYSQLTGTTQVLLVAHEQGVLKGWKRFSKANGNSLHWFMSQGDNTTLGTSVLDSDTAGVWANERLVRLSTSLIANRCIETGGGSCTGNNGGSPDGDRISSNEATGFSGDNSGGGLGNWHDMNYCCHTSSLAGHTCNGQAIRTASEAQVGWGYTSQFGTFGTDSLQPMTNTQQNGNCGTASWARANGQPLDYAIYVR